MNLTAPDNSLKRDPGFAQSGSIGRELLTWSPALERCATARSPIDQEVQERSRQVEPMPTRLRILVVEDDPITQEIVLLMLMHLGYPAHRASNGSEALVAACAATYDVILMDLRMPEMDGIEATRRIRSQDSVGLHPTIVAMTASLSSEDQQTCVDAGIDQHLLKPLRIDVLATGLERWLLHHQS